MYKLVFKPRLALVYCVRTSPGNKHCLVHIVINKINF